MSSTSERPPLDRDRIVRAGVELADEHGVGPLSMRKLAAHLGYEVMSLYNHVDSKSDLLDGMVDLVAGEFDAPDPDLEWRPAVRHLAVSAHDALLRHRWVTALWSSSWPGPHRWRYMELLLRILGDADLPDDVADLAFHAVTLHVTGFTQQQVSYRARAAGDGEAEMLARVRIDAPETEFPHIHAHLRYHADRDAGRDEPADEFGFVLDLILDGIEQAQRRAASAPGDHTAGR